jgi:hypothetical protein
MMMISQEILPGFFPEYTMLGEMYCMMPEFLAGIPEKNPDKRVEKQYIFT